MTGNEILVSLFGVCLGYWLISKFTGGPAATKREPIQPDNPTPGKTGPDVPPLVFWYETLNVSPQATISEIQCAHAALIKQYDLDQAAGTAEELKLLAETRTKAIHAAYAEALRARSDPP